MKGLVMNALLSFVALVSAADPAPLTTVSVTGEVRFQGKLLVQCSAANPIARPTAPNPPGWQFRGGSPGRDASGAYLRLNFHHGTAKVAGQQEIGPGKGSVSIEYSPRDGAPFTSYFGIPGQSKVTLAPDFKSATVEARFSSAISDDPVVTAKATVVCQ
jgi:hypothetical protein